MGSIVVINTPLSKLKDILLTYIKETNRERETHTQSQYTYTFIPMLKKWERKGGAKGMRDKWLASILNRKDQ